MTHPWIADRANAFDSSGIRKVFDLAAQMTDPINLSIGQPDFDVPEPVKEAYCQAVRDGKNGYALTQGMPVLRERLQADVEQRYGHADRQAFVCSGTSGGLTLVMLALVNPGDEVIIFDPYFVMYDSLVRMVGGTPVILDTYPDFRPDLNQVADAITDRTKMILVNSPANPTGVTLSREALKDLAELAAERDVALVSDEIYSSFCYDEPFVSPAEFNERTIVIDGFSKSHAMTGWRLGQAHGPRDVIETMIKLQQYTFVCAPQPAQWAGAAAADFSVQPYVEAYKVKRDLLMDGLRDRYEFQTPGGAFYLFPQAPGDEAGDEFVARAIANNLLIIPGNIFSRRNSHFRVSYAADNATIERGVEVLRKLLD